MKAKFYLLFLVVFFLQNCSVSKIEQAFNALNKRDFRKVKKIFEELEESPKYTAATQYGLGVILAEVDSVKRYAKRSNELDVAYNSVYDAEMNYPALDEKTKTLLKEKYKFSNGSIGDYRAKIRRKAHTLAVAEHELRLYGVPDSTPLKHFIATYSSNKSKDDDLIRKSKQYLLEMCMFTENYKDQSINYYLDFIAKYSKYFNTITYKPKTELIAYIRKALYILKTDDCQDSSFLAFQKTYRGYIDDKIIQADRKNCQALYTYITKNDTAHYTDFVKNVAPRSYAFLAVQQLIKQYIDNKQYTIAIALLNDYSKYFDFGFGKQHVEELIKILERQDYPVEYTPIKQINTKDGDEHSPVMAIDNTCLYFCASKRKENLSPGFQDIFACQIKDGFWEKPKILENVNEVTQNEAPLSITADGKKLLLFVDGNIFYSDKQNDKWSKPKSFFYKGQNDWKEGMLTVDGNAIMYASDGYGNIGGHHRKGLDFYNSLNGNTDLYVSVRNGNTWDVPINLGDAINTPFCERSPFLHPDMKTLYFSSNGLGGVGGLDLYVTRRLSDTSWTQWSKPENLGKLINTTGDDLDYKISTDGQTALFASKVNKSYDIYYFNVPPKFRPDSVTLVKGAIYDAMGNPVQNTTIVIQDQRTGRKVTETLTQDDGNFMVVLQMAITYGYYVKSEKYYGSGNFKVTSKRDSVVIKHEIKIETYQSMIEKGIVVPINNLFFDFNKAIIKKESYEELNKLADILKMNNSLKVEISGYTDDIGDNDFNLQLSQNRAEAVREYLVKKGCKADMLTAKGYGKSKPKNENNTDKARAENRRVEIKFIK